MTKLSENDSNAPVGRSARSANSSNSTPVEEDLIETKLRLGGLVRALRERSHLSQAALAKRIGSSQPRVAKIESHDPEVSLDLQMKGDLCLSTIGLPRTCGSHQEVGGPHFGKRSCAHATAGENASSTPRAQYQNRCLTLLLLSPCMVSTRSGAACPV